MKIGGLNVNTDMESLKNSSIFYTPKEVSPEAATPPATEEEATPEGKEDESLDDGEMATNAEQQQLHHHRRQFVANFAHPPRIHLMRAPAVALPAAFVVWTLNSRLGSRWSDQTTCHWRMHQLHWSPPVKSSRKSRAISDFYPFRTLSISREIRVAVLGTSRMMSHRWWAVVAVEEALLVPAAALAEASLEARRYVSMAPAKGSSSILSKITNQKNALSRKFNPLTIKKKRNFMCRASERVLSWVVARQADRL